MSILDFIKDKLQAASMPKVLESGMCVVCKGNVAVVVHVEERECILDFTLFLKDRASFVSAFGVEANPSGVVVNRADLQVVPMLGQGSPVYCIVKDSSGKRRYTKGVVKDFDVSTSEYTCAIKSGVIQCGYFDIVQALKKPPKFLPGNSLRYDGQHPVSLVSVVVKEDTYAYGVAFKGQPPAESRTSDLVHRLPGPTGAWVFEDSLVRGGVPVLLDISFLFIKIFKSNRKIILEYKGKPVDVVGSSGDIFLKAYQMFHKFSTQNQQAQKFWVIIYRVQETGEYKPFKVYLSDIDFSMFQSIVLGNCFSDNKEENLKTLAKSFSSLFKVRS